jgi:glycosyltransferase involved in cell wall biosynthesis
VSTAERPIRVLYVVYWGALESLGQSLVVPAVLLLAKLGVELTLITFEKPNDLADQNVLGALRAAFAEANVRWHPLRYHKKPKWPATAWDGFAAVLKAIQLNFGGSFDVVHTRSFVAGPMGFVIARLLGARFVYHNEGFYPDEQVDGGVWKEGSKVHRLARHIESFLYDHADGIIALSERARTILTARPKVAKWHVPVIVVPSAVDLNAFQPPPARSSRARTRIRLIYLGSVGLRYRLDDAGRFVAAVRRLQPDTTLTVVSRADTALVTSMLDDAGLHRDAWTLKELPHREVPAELHRHDAGLFFLTEGLSEHGCSPTKIGEYWACGLPVVTTPNVSDTDAIVQAGRVGVVVRPHGKPGFDDGARALLDLLGDPALATRCRQAAEYSYALDASCLRQANLYRELVS